MPTLSRLFRRRPSEFGFSEFVWGTVQFENPLSIRLDGETSPIGVAIDSLVERSLLRVGDRVRCEFDGRRLIVWGIAGVDIAYRSREQFSRNHQWQDLELLNGWSPRSGYYTPQVRVTSGGMAQLRGGIVGGDDTNGTIVADLPTSGTVPDRHVTVPFASNNGYTVTLNISSVDGSMQLVTVTSMTSLFFDGVIYSLHENAYLP